MGKHPVRTISTDGGSARLSDLPDPDLRARWEAVFKASPPSGSRREFLAGSLAYREQEMAEGGLSSQAQKYLRDITRSLTQKTPAISHLGPLKAGTRLLRTWQGECHEVLVLEKGFAYQEVTYASLSEIARAITGARWSGPLFFGLKPPSPFKRVAKGGR